MVKVRYAPFITVTHGAPLPAEDRQPPADESAGAQSPGGQWGDVIARAAQAALAMFTPGRPVRLLGVRAEFADKPA